MARKRTACASSSTGVRRREAFHKPRQSILGGAFDRKHKSRRDRIDADAQGRPVEGAKACRLCKGLLGKKIPRAFDIVLRNPAIKEIDNPARLATPRKLAHHLKGRKEIDLQILAQFAV